VSFRYPPFTGRDADLSSSLFKYFKKIGVETFIITSKPTFFDKLLNNSEEIINGNILRVSEFFILRFLRRFKVFREIFRTIMFPDQYLDWTLMTLPRAVQFIRKNRITHLIVTVPPANNLLLGYLIKKLTNSRLIFYLRDLWTQNPYLNLNRRYYYILAKKIERKVLKNADKILVASDSYRKILSNSGISSKNVYFIPIGYDESLFMGIRPLKLKKFTILHAGTIYPGNYVNPIHLFRALELISKLNYDILDRFQVLFCGKCPEYVSDLVYKFQLKNVKILGNLPKKSALRLMISSDLNLVLLYPKKETKIIIPSKVYEYIKANKPILGLVPPDGECAKIIRKFKFGTVINPNNIIEIKNFILNKIKKDNDITIQNSISEDYSNEFQKSFERLNIAKRILQLID